MSGVVVACTRLEVVWYLAGSVAVVSGALATRNGQKKVLGRATWKPSSVGYGYWPLELLAGVGVAIWVVVSCIVDAVG